MKTKPERTQEWLKPTYNDTRKAEGEKVEIFKNQNCMMYMVLEPIDVKLYFVLQTSVYN